MSLMIGRFLQCIAEDCQLLPTNIYVWLGAILCFGTVLLWTFLGFRKGTRWAAVLLLVEYLFWTYSMTVIFREVQETQSYNLNLFWSYRAIKAGDSFLLVQDIMNVAAFVPVGLLMGCSNVQLKWWHMLLFGLALSLSIEILQFFTLRGFAEFDDVFHNTLGCLIGYGVFKGISSLKTRVKKEV